MRLFPNLRFNSSQSSINVPEDSVTVRIELLAVSKIALSRNTFCEEGQILNFLSSDF